MQFSVRLAYRLIFVLLSFNSNQVLASQCETLFFDQSLLSDRTMAIPSARFGNGFIVPNEKNIGVVRATFAAAAPGIYVSVGTERGFIGAALTGSATKALVLVDVDPRVSHFNLMNKSLHELARDREDYLDLRQRASVEVIASRVRAASLSSDAREILLNRENWAWWTQNVQKLEAWQEFHDPAQTSYKDGNYLFDDALFNSVSTLAKQGRIFVYNLDLKSDEVRAKLFGLTQALDSRVAVFDVSNAWDEGYLGLRTTIGILGSLKEITNPQTYFVFTYLAVNPEARDAGSIFKYWIIRNADVVRLDELGPMLGSLMRQDPSRGSAYVTSRLQRGRSRADRYD